LYSDLIYAIIFKKYVTFPNALLSYRIKEAVMRKIKRILLCLLTVVIMLSALSSCRDPYIGLLDSRSTYNGISLTVNSIDYTEDGIKLNTVWANTTSHEAVYGVEYTVERYVDGDWINSMRSDVAFIEIACILSPNSNNEMTYSLSHADISREGTYRIRTSCYVHDKDEVIFCSLAANFTVDNERTAFGYHKLNYRIEGNLYEDLRPYYKAGERVSVKIAKMTDLGFDMYLNGEKLKYEKEAFEYWEYSFIMPDAPAFLEFKTYDGMTE